MEANTNPQCRHILKAFNLVSSVSQCRGKDGKETVDCSKLKYTDGWLVVWVKGMICGKA